MVNCPVDGAFGTFSALVAELSSSSLIAKTSQNVDQRRWTAWIGPLLVVAYWLINCLVVSPAGNFPLNDDWLYSESVGHLLQTGQFRLVGCSPACVPSVWNV